MREIEFRVWNGKDIMKIDREYLRLGGGRSVWGYANERDKLIANHENGVLMQYIGLKDKNNTPIYEGDVVRIKGMSITDKYGINRDYSIVGDMVNFLCDMVGGYEGIPTTDMEVIGNIYQNPELLEKAS